METYIRKRQNTVTQYIATQPILDLCKATERKWEAQVVIRWGGESVIDLVVVRDVAATEGSRMG